MWKGEKLQKFEYLENEKSFLDEILKRKQSLSPDVNHTLNLLITPKGRQEPCTKVQSQNPAEQISRI